MNERWSALGSVILGVLVAAGLAGAGYFIGDGLYAARTSERFVTARGLVERPVKANLGVWTISFSRTGDDVTKVNAQIENDSSMVEAFVHKQGFTEAEIEPLATKVTDQLASGNQQISKEGRYVIKGGVKVRSANVEQVRQTSSLTGELIKQGIVLITDYENGGSVNPAYFFTKLDSIRPGMLAEATRSARLVAQQFANDSGSRLGNIKRANQGVFEITGRDSSSSNGQEELGAIDKKVRLVTTIDYALVN